MSNDFQAEDSFPRHGLLAGVRAFFRTLKEQLLWVRHFRDLADFQEALRVFTGHL